jgi:hypothetical protein
VDAEYGRTASNASERRTQPDPNLFSLLLIRDDEVFSAEKIRRCQAESSRTETEFF